MTGDRCYAIGIYPSAAIDASGRRDFLEKHLLEWQRPPEVPAATGALLLLPLVAHLDSSEWWARSDDPRWTGADYVMDLPSGGALPCSPDLIEEAVAEGRRGLAEATSEEALAELYALLLAGNGGVPLRGLEVPLPPAAVAALLLPLPRELADRLSVGGWLPSSWLSNSVLPEIRESWDLLLGGETSIPTSGFVEPTAEHLRRAREMASAVFADIPARVEGSASKSAALSSRPLQLALWGPTSAGKTALLAELFLDGAGSADWDVYPTQRSLQFIHGMRTYMNTNNSFPNATTVGYAEALEYQFAHRRTGATALLQLEDRPGEDSREFAERKGKTDFNQRLGSADGLVLVFDTRLEASELERLLASTLEILHVASGRIGRKDLRPIAVCVSKADVNIHTPADYHRAMGHPDEFVRERLDGKLVELLDHYCERYRLFPVSAAGVRLRYGAIEPVVFIDESLQNRLCPGGRPLNLMAPFAWLLDQLTGVS
ncbi:MAG: hypothetical protein JOZ54_07550 [Acidobacteria bacterium]|nr:hypothetical protein [Acidobacteriota bacterium]